MSHHRHALVACARWEEQHVTEWVAYHRSIGFDHIYLYSNDDEPETLRQVLLPYLLEPTPYLTYRHFPYVGRQAEIYMHFIQHFMGEVDWFCFLDIDEFIVTPGWEPIGAFLERYEAAWDCIYLNWILFGHGGRATRGSGSVLLNHTSRAGSVDPHTKNFVRAAAVDAREAAARFARAPVAFWHFWGTLNPGLRICNVLGEGASTYTHDWPRHGEAFSQRPGIVDAVRAHGYVAHYIFKSEEDFLRREKRGAIGSFAAQGEWAQLYRDGGHRAVLDRLNAVVDHSLAQYWARVLERLGPVRILPPPRGRNLALGRPARQSSVYADQGPSGGNNGVHTGGAGFHTALEPGPWWEVDLGAIQAVREIRLFNRIDDPGCRARVAPMHLEISQDGTTWQLVRAEIAAFGGIDGAPLLAELTPPLPARWVRVRLVATNYLHLDEVEVYGESGTTAH